MNDLHQNNPSQLSETEVAQLVRKLLHKEDTWVEWGLGCQKLQKSGYSPQKIFEETGFQSSQQNLVIVAAQVYESIVKEGVSQEVLSYFKGPRSDVLYEFRILNQQQRATAATLATEKKLAGDEARDVAKAIKEFSCYAQLPAGFEDHPGDAVAYQCWKLARQKKDLQERSRLIAKGLRFAHSQTARQQIEQLLSDFTVVPGRTAPLLPVYRLEAEEELPRLVPVVGTLPLSVQELEAVVPLMSVEPFGMVEYSGNGAMVPLPGWQVILKTVTPVVLFSQTDQLPQPLPGLPEPVLVVVDLKLREWDENSYFLVEKEGPLELQWFEHCPELKIWGKVILILRQKKILDEQNLTEPWQMDD
ncbi:MAG: hypothetical protein DSM107014_09350 [Gomphosphaeria aponina SAG 52.96 = DSM 107014]|uniref:RuBisCO accumulation factor 1 n=1 Tax=Gomphosphaeria aponina SAG 52.96 = DSM 107014 TaxID=1521640 RepID=A0A941JMD4_9CHRO|nr:hypothetical protein [Gomphosphaeria aponina SAG 52.96 = DSM 107014]